MFEIFLLYNFESSSHPVIMSQSLEVLNQGKRMAKWKFNWNYAKVGWNVTWHPPCSWKNWFITKHDHISFSIADNECRRNRKNFSELLVLNHGSIYQASSNHYVGHNQVIFFNLDILKLSLSFPRYRYSYAKIVYHLLLENWECISS